MGKTELKKLQDSYGYEVGPRAIRGPRGRRRSEATPEPDAAVVEEDEVSTDVAFEPEPEPNAEPVAEEPEPDDVVVEEDEPGPEPGAEPVAEEPEPDDVVVEEDEPGPEPDAEPVADAGEESDMDVVEDSPVEDAEEAGPVEVTPAKKKKKKKPNPYTACGQFSRKPKWSKKKSHGPPRTPRWWIEACRLR